jgi:hypothetical protein
MKDWIVQAIATVSVVIAEVGTTITIADFNLKRLSVCTFLMVKTYCFLHRQSLGHLRSIQGHTKWPSVNK